VDANGRVTSVTTSPVVATGYVPEGRLIIAGTGLTGGGSLANNVTLSVNLATATPQALGTATAGVSTAAAREDHVHPAVDLSDTNETQGSLPLGRGGTGDALSPVAGAVVYSTGTKFALTNPGVVGQVLTSTGTDEPVWTTVTGTGTVTSIDASGGGTGMTFTGGPITTAGTLTLGGTLGVGSGGTGLTATPTNGQLAIGNGSGYTLATLTAGTAVSITNALGSITIDNTAPDQIVSLTAGTAINISGTYPNFTVANTAPDQIVSLTGAGTTSISGTYPNFTITSNDQFAGTVTSVAASGGTTGLTFSGSPITSAGTLTLGGTLAIGSGGTGASTAGAARTALGAAALGANTDITSIALTSGTIQNAPTSGTDIVNKAYADSIASGINFHQAVRLATVAALPAYTYNNGTGGVGATITANANGALSIDGVAVVAGNRVLIKDEVGAAQANHGVYVVTQTGDGSTPFILTRATDFDSTGTGVDQIDAGDFFLVTAGATLANTSWVQQTPLPITVGTTPIIFSQFGAPVLYTAGTGLTLAGTVFSITNTGVAASTYGSASQVPVIAVNAQGQITSANSTSIAIAASQITSGVLPVGNGGTGATTLTANGVLLGNGTSAVSATAVGTTGQVLVGNTGAAPTWATLSSAAVTSFSAGTTGLTPSTATTGAITLGGTLAVANGGTGVTTSTGTGSVVLNTSPTLVTPSLGVASADSIATLKGTVGAVAYGFIGNTNTGMWSPSSDAIAFSTAGSERLRIASDGNVGIGTNNPTFLLQVNGTGYFNSNVAFFPQDGFRFTSVSAVSAMRFGSAFTGESTAEWAYNRAGAVATLSIGATGSALTEIMRAQSNGNVGIGTSAPAQTLQVVNAGNYQFRLGAGSTFNYDLGRSGSDGLLYFYGNQASFTGYVFGGVDGERMRINSAGNVGIGTSAPTQRLDILDQNNAGFRLTQYSDVDGAVLRLFAGRGTIAAPTAVTTDSMVFGIRGIGYTSAGAFGIASVTINGRAAENFTATAQGTYLQFSTTALGTATVVERMRITGGGNVGIGTTAPQGLLHVVAGTDNSLLFRGPINYATGGSIYAVNSANSAITPMEFGASAYFFAGGNVGIGTSAPSEKFEVANSTAAFTVMRATNSAGYGKFGVRDTGDAYVEAPSGKAISFWNTAERMRITDTGNVGIGITNPAARLQVRQDLDGTTGAIIQNRNGSGTPIAALRFITGGLDLSDNRYGAVESGGVAAADLRFITSSGGPVERMRITSVGRVGIGTSAPIQIFQVTTSGQSIDGPFFTSSTGPWMRFIPNSSPGAYNGLVAAGTNAFIFSSGSANAGTLTIAPWADGSSGVVINASGNVGIGTNNLTGRLGVAVTGSRTIGTAWDASSVLVGSPGQFSGNLGFSFDTTNGGTIESAAPGVAAYPVRLVGSDVRFLTALTERMRIDGSGNVLVGTTSTSGIPTGSSSNPGAFIESTGTLSIQRNNNNNIFLSKASGYTSGGFISFQVAGSQVGFIAESGGGTVYSTSSDARLKHDIVDAPEASSLIDAMQVRSFKWNADDSEQRYGFVAQELIEVAPEAVSIPADEDQMMGVDYSKLVPMLVKEIQSLRARVAQLEGN
jgi:hypothetical protein